MTVKSTSNALGFAQVTGLGTAKALTLPASRGDGAVTMAFVQCEGQSVRWRDDGVDPTATLGMLLPVGGQLTYDGDISKLKFIQTAATATLSVSFYN